MNKRTKALIVTIAAGAIALGGCAKTGAVKGDTAPVPPPAVTGTTPPTQGKGSTASTTLPQQPVRTEAIKPETGAAGTEKQNEATLQTVLFGFDSYLLEPPSRKILQENARYLKDHQETKIRIEGNTDERGSEEYNLALGDKRARAAMEYLVTLGIPSSRLSTVSYGKEKPVDQRHEEAAWSRNRRDDFVIAH